MLKISVKVKPSFSPFLALFIFEVSTDSFLNVSIQKSPKASSETLEINPIFLPSLESPIAIFAGEPPKYFIKVSHSDKLL